MLSACKGIPLDRGSDFLGKGEIILNFFGSNSSCSESKIPS